MSSYNNYCSPEIISHPQDWVSPQGLLNPFNPINLFRSEIKEEIKVSDSFSLPKQPFCATSYEALEVVLILVLFIIFINKLFEKIFGKL